MDWRFSTFLLFLFALFFGITWATSQDGICHSQFVLDVLALDNKDGALNCFDFWLNRCHSLLGALAALGAAWYAGQWVRRQVILSRLQVAAALLATAEESVDRIERLSALATLFHLELHTNTCELMHVSWNSETWREAEDDEELKQIAAHECWSGITSAKNRLRNLREKMGQVEIFSGLGRISPDGRNYFSDLFRKLHIDADAQDCVLRSLSIAVYNEDAGQISRILTAMGEERAQQGINGTRNFDREELHRVLNLAYANIDRIRREAGAA